MIWYGSVQWIEQLQPREAPEIAVGRGERRTVLDCERRQSRVAHERAATVLVVDDNPQAVELLATQLTSAGVNVLRAYGGREAIQVARDKLPDLILLDLMMPDVSGFEVVLALKARPETAGIPVIVVTAKDLSAEERAALNGHVLGITNKTSFDGGSFVNEVRRALRSKGRG